MSFEIHRETIFRRYYAPYNSAACCYGIVYAFAIFLLPLIIAYNSTGFWLKENFVYEQPDVSYSYNTIFQASVASTDANQQIQYKHLYYSSNRQLNTLFSNSLRLGILSTAEVDVNRDSLTDRLEMNILFPLAPDENLHAINVLTVFEVKLSSKAKYLFETATLMKYESPIPIGNVFVEGNLNLHQTMPLFSKGGYRSLGQDDILPISKYTSAEDVSIAEALRRSASKNLSLTFVPTYSYGEASMMTPISENYYRYANATFIQHVPIQNLIYTPSVSEVLKHAWIQYISFFAVVSFLLFRMNSFVFRHQLLYTKPVVDIKLEKLE